MGRRSPARWLAPLALVAVVVALFAVVGGSGGGGGDEEPANTTAPTQTTKSSSGKDAEKEPASKRSRKTYTVKLGDTPSQIASDNDITLEQLQTLNPDLDPQLLTPGDKLRIRK